jgi:serine phosphatase RsbU (regulator of sigma subunit)
VNLLTWKAPAEAWRGLLTGTALLVAAAALLALRTLLGAGDGRLVQAAMGALLGVSWLAAARFVLLDLRGRRFWSGSLLLALGLVVVAGKTGLVLGIVWSGFFLSLRRYRCWRHVSDRRRAVGFGLGALSLVIIILSWSYWGLAPGNQVGPLRALGGWSLVSLAMFWVHSMFHLAMNMRLHFLRLRPKLAVSAVLIGVVPLLLVVALGLAILYTGLGGARAARAGAMLESWRRLAAQGVDLSPALFDTTFSWPEPAGAAPAWTPKMAAALRRSIIDDAQDAGDDEADSTATPAMTRALAAAAVPADSTGWFLADRRLWLIRWQGLDGDAPRAQAWQLNRKPLTELSRVLRVGIVLAGNGRQDSNGNISFGSRDTTGNLSLGRLEASYRDPAKTGGYFGDAMYFGGTFLGLGELQGEHIESRGIFMRLRVGTADLKADFIQGESNVNVAVVVALCLVAFLFLVIEGFALFFGVRISEGIVTGVHELHRGTQALAGGDLDTVITIPNEDEFGDLARSFNEMTLAVKHGREIALANDRLKQELATARAIQIRLLPGTQPLVPGFEVTGASIPSREIGGDYYDFLTRRDDAIGIAIGDVSGKGMPAALLMSNLQACLHGQVLHPGTVASVVQRVNDLLVRSTDSHMFATFFYGVLETATGRFVCTNAGHNPPLVLRRDGSLERLTTGGLLLGMMGDMVYQQATVDLAPGEVIVMYTDGITEAVGPGVDEDDPDAMFGEDRLCNVILNSRHLPASGIQDAILAAVADHTRGVAQSDDITLVVLRRQD